MAWLKSINTGPFTASTSWALCDLILNSRANSTTIGQTISGPAGVALGAITVQGVGLQLSGRAVVPSGTFTVQLNNTSTNTSIAIYTMNVSDLPNNGAGVGANNLGWIYIKFSGGPHTLAAGNYNVRLSASAVNQVSVYRDATANNWSRVLVTTTNQAPVAADNLIICGEYANGDSGSVRTVTLNGLYSANSFGISFIAHQGELKFATSASTSMAISGASFITGGGLLEIGNSGSTWSPNVTASLLLNPPTTFATVLSVINGTMRAFGDYVIPKAKLNADISVNAAVATTDVVTGWKNNSRILFASTTTAATQTEIRSLTADSVSNTINFQPVGFAHGGNANTLIQGDIANLTRTVRIFSPAVRRANILVNSSVTGTIGQIDLNNVELFDLGAATTQTTQSGILVNAGGNLRLINSSMYYNNVSATDFGGIGVYSSTHAVDAYVSGCTFYGIDTGILNGTSISNHTFEVTDSFFSRCNTGIDANPTFLSATTRLTNISVAGCSSNGISLSSPSNPRTLGFILSGITSYGNSSGIVMGQGNWFYGTQVINDIKVWRNTTGIVLPIMIEKFSEVKINNAYFFSNVTNFTFGNGAKSIFENSYFWGGTNPTTSFFHAPSNISTTDSIYFNKCYIGINNTGGTSNFGTAIFGINNLSFQSVILTNCAFSGTEAAFIPAAVQLGIIGNFSAIGPISLNHNNIARNNKIFTAAGTISTDSVYTFNGADTLRYTPVLSSGSSFNPELRTNLFNINVNSGQTCSVSVSVRKSAAPDTVYNGNEPRLIYGYNPLAGNFSETVCSTATSASNGAWETLSYTTPVITASTSLGFYVDCDGSAGFINIANFTGSTVGISNSLTYWDQSGPNVELAFTTGGTSSATVSYTFIS